MSVTSEIVVDKRETRSGVPRLLESMGVRVTYRTLALGDYVVASGFAFERKAARDFVYSLFSGRLFDQVSRLSECYGEPLLIVEGDLSEALGELPNPRGVWGAMATLVFDYGGHMFYTGNQLETASLLYVLAKRSPCSRNVRPIIYRKARVRTIEDAQLSVLCNLPGIGPKLAERVLAHFGTLRKALEASCAELRKIEGIGGTKAKRITDILDSPHTIGTRYLSQAKLER